MAETMKLDEALRELMEHYIARIEWTDQATFETSERLIANARAALAAHEAGQPALPSPYTAAHIAGEDRDLFTAEQMKAQYRQAALDCAAACERLANRYCTAEECADACRAIAERGAKESGNG